MKVEQEMEDSDLEKWSEIAWYHMGVVALQRVECMMRLINLWFIVAINVV
jgi:hypothetical protein